MRPVRRPHVIFGYGTDETMGETLQVTVIATGFQGSAANGGRFAPASIEADPPRPAAARIEQSAPAGLEVDAGPAPEPSVPADPEPEPIPAAEAWSAEDAEVGSEPMADPEPMAEPEPEFVSGLLAKAAAAGADADLWAPAAVSGGRAGYPAAEVLPPEDSPVAPFLRRVGTRNIAQVEVPDLDQGPLTPKPRQTAGFGSASPGDDLNAPAYTRKYMD